MKKTAIVCIIAMMALAVMGFGFAKWSDVVAIDNTVETGNVATTIAPGDSPVTDLGADPQYPPGHNEEGKDVGNITCVQGEDDHNLTVTIQNGYPYYKPGFTFVITSTGSIPVKIESIDGPNWDGDLADYIKVADWSYTVVNPASNGKDAVNTTVSSGMDNATWQGLVESIGNTQLHQNGTLTVTVNFYIDETDDGTETGVLCPMNSSASGTITITSAQWNEVPAEGPGV